MMRNLIKMNNVAASVGIAILFVLAISGCKKNDNKVEPTPIPVPVVIQNPKSTTYPLSIKDMLGVTGTVTFTERSVGSSESVVKIQLTGAPSGVHPAHIHANTAIETGGIVHTLNSVDSSGNSTTNLTVPYETLINFDGYVNVHLDPSTLGTIIAQGDIGGNILTGDNRNHSLVQDSSSGVSGNIRFDKRKNGNTLVTITLSSSGFLPTGSYPASINLGSVATIGTPYARKTLQPVDYATRKSMTTVRTMDDGTPITYQNWLVYDGFVTVYDANDNSNVIAKGNIGSN
jgi:uncharacterized lipoprotein YbaY